MCGAIAGITGTSIIYPIDIVKTHLQNQPLKYKDCCKHLIKQNGLKSLYKGLVPNLIGVTPEKAIKLAVNDLMREKLALYSNCSTQNLPIKLGMVAGATAGFCQVIATNPMEIVKIQMQISNQNKPSLLTILNKLGLKGMYKGTPITLLRDVPFSLIFFPFHAYLVQKVSTWEGETTFKNIFFSGIISGAISAILVTPADVVKTRVQAGLESRDSFSMVLKKIIQQESPKALFKGSIQRAFIVAPLFAISLLTYEAQKILFT